MGILPAVFSDTGEIPLDVPGIQECPVEWRRQEQHQAVVAPDETLLHGLHCPVRALRVACTGDDRPRLGNGVDLALVVLRRSERRPVIEEGAPVPLPVPRLLLQRSLERFGAAPPTRRTLVFAAEIGDAGEVPQIHEQKPAKPHAFSPALMADPVHTVVPVAGPDQGKAMAAHLEAAVQGPRAVLVQSRPLF